MENKILGGFDLYLCQFINRKTLKYTNNPSLLYCNKTPKKVLFSEYIYIYAVLFF